VCVVYVRWSVCVVYVRWSVCVVYVRWSVCVVYAEWTGKELLIWCMSFVCMYVCMHACTWGCVGFFVWAGVHMSVCVCMCVCVCVCMRMRMRMQMYLCTYTQVLYEEPRICLPYTNTRTYKKHTYIGAGLAFDMQTGRNRMVWTRRWEHVQRLHTKKRRWTLLFERLAAALGQNCARCKEGFYDRVTCWLRARLAEMPAKVCMGVQKRVCLVWELVYLHHAGVLGCMSW
jgi:hypothetical protein